MRSAMLELRHKAGRELTTFGINWPAGLGRRWGEEPHYRFVRRASDDFIEASLFQLKWEYPSEMIRSSIKDHS